MPQLTWHNISVEVFEKQRSLFWNTTIKKRIILNDVSGIARSGCLVAIMGASGSGKTTFMNAISGRLREMKGVVKINDKIIENIKDMSGYVHQQDIFTESLTAFEHLQFMAAFQIGDKSKERRCLIIKELLSELSLESTNNTMIKNLSSGEKRRLSLAGELLSNPFILFCDEPTTGLDSYSAITVIQKLQAIALSGKIVLTTIHQPSSQLFHYFDNITLLAEGKLIFQGTIEEAKSFFESLNLFCPTSYNPADFYIKCLNHEEVSKMYEIFEMRKSQNKETLQHCDDPFSKKCNIGLNFCHELKWLMWRIFTDMKRNKTFRISTYYVVMVELLMVASFYATIKLSDIDSVQNIQGVLAFIATEMTYSNMYAVINVFPEEVAVFLREKHLYSSYSYFMSKILSLVPLCLFSTVIYMSIFFIIMEFLKGFHLWLQMTYMMFLVSMVSSSIGLSFSATFSKVDHIDLLMGPLEFVLMLLSGFFVRLDNIPIFFSWLRYFSPFYYGFKALSYLFWIEINNIGNCQGNETIPCYQDGTEVLKNYGIHKNYDTVAYDVLYLHILITVFCLMGFVGILRKKLLYNI